MGKWLCRRSLLYRRFVDSWLVGEKEWSRRNDIDAGIAQDLGRWEKDLMAMDSLARNHGTKLYLLNPPVNEKKPEGIPFADRYFARKERLRALAESGALAVIDADARLAEAKAVPESLFLDSYHLNGKGAAETARIAALALLTP